VKAGTQEGNKAQDVGINKQEVHLQDQSVLPYSFTKYGCLVAAQLSPECPAFS